AVSASPAIAPNGTIWIGGHDGIFRAIDPRGFERATYDAALPIEGSAVVAADGRAFIGTGDGHLLGFTREGRLSFSTAAGEAVFYAPVIGADGLVHVGTSDGFLVTVDAYGNVVSRLKLGGRLNAPTIAEDGTLYVTTFEGKSLEAVRAGCAGLARGGWPSFAGPAGRSMATRR
ncbi:MAG TPA: hypothetical protein VGR00_14850, partial [Thermoanaerobaculia bacterium]|nr:hypothetical protein [Thermoanaerobaculia bacterium]